jgi:hypothetical protein
VEGMMKYICLLIVILLNHSIGYSQEPLNENEIEDEISRLSEIRSNLTDSLAMIISKIDSLTELRNQAEFNRIRNEGTILTLRSDSELYETRSSFSDVIEIIPSGSEVGFLGIDGSAYIEVAFQGNVGFIQEWNFVERDLVDQLLTDFNEEQREIREIQQREMAEQQREAQRQEIEQRRRNFIQENADISEVFKEYILEGTVSIGMTTEMVIASWGEPDDINRTVTVGSVSEQWIYGEIPNAIFIYFTDGVMTAFQD